MKEVHFLRLREVLDQEKAEKEAYGASEAANAASTQMVQGALNTESLTPTQEQFASNLASFRNGDRPKSVDKGYSGFRIPYEGREPEKL